MVYFIDTNIFLRVFDLTGNKTMHNDCVSFVSAVRNKKIKSVTSNLVLSEIVWTSKRFYEFPKPKIIDALNSIVNLKIPLNNNFQTQVAIEIFKKNSVKFIDAQIASIPEIYKKEWTVVSYDEDFDKIGVKRKEPNEVKL